METVGARDLVGFSAISSKWHPCPRVRESPEVKQQALGACEARGEGAGSVLRSTVKFDFIDPVCPDRDVLCGFLLCVNISGAPRLGDLGGDISSVTFYHQGKELDCRCCLGPWLGRLKGQQ